MKTPFQLISCLMFLVFSNYTFAQVDFEWAQQISGPVGERPEAMATDANGNSVVAGLYFSPMLTIGNTTLINANDNQTFFDIYLAKYDAAGNVLWATTAGGAGHEGVLDIALDGQGNIYMAGYYSETATFDDQVLDNLNEAFIAKYNSAGQLVWIKETIGTTTGINTSPKSITVDASGNIYLGGGSLGSTDLDFFGYAYEGNTETDGYLMKMDTEGNILWMKILDAQDPNNIFNGIHQVFHELSINPSNDLITVSGTFGGVVDFGGTTLTSSIYGAPNVTNKDIFVATYHPNGDLEWAKGIGTLPDPGFEFAQPQSIGIDASDNVYLAGSLYGKMVFDNGETVAIEGFDLYNPTRTELFVAKYNAQGSLQWVEKVYSINDDNKDVEPEGIRVDGNGNSYLTGYFEWDPSFGDIQMPLLNNVSSFVAKLNTNGIFEWAVAGGSFGFNSGIDIGIDDAGNAYAAGHHQFTPTFGSFELGDGGTQGTFVIKVSGTTNTEDLQYKRDFSLSPNPASNWIRIQPAMYSELSSTVLIHDLLGQLVYTQTLDAASATIDIQQLDVGVYQLSLRSGSHITTRKFIKQ